MARENFPVGSALIAPRLRGAVAAFYAFARAADDAADDPSLPPERKLARLDAFEGGLDGAEGGATEGRRLAAALAEVGRPGGAEEARRLLRAFRADARGLRCATWGDLMAYCADSADPVGRFLLDLHGEGPEGVGASDALCTALQVLNHLQDLRVDHLRLGRRYLPGDWLREEGATDQDLGREAATPALRRAIGRALERTEGLLDRAEALPGLLRSRRLAGEAEAILHLARRLQGRLRRADPLAGRVAPTRLDWAGAAAWGVLRLLRPARAGAARGAPA